MEFKENLSSADQILTHLKACDPVFYKELSSRVDISEYSAKLSQKSFRHEAWDNDELVGLVAVYYNNDPKGFDFITDVSVVNSAAGQGVASKLLQSCIDKAKSGGSAELKLEVEANNKAALSLYDKFGFVRKEATEVGLMLSLPLDT